MFTCHRACRAMRVGFHSPSSAAIISHSLQRWPPSPSNRWIVVDFLLDVADHAKSKTFIVCPLIKCSSLFHCLSIIGLFIYHLVTVRRLFVVRHACIVALPRVDCCVRKKNSALATMTTRPRGSRSHQRYHESQCTIDNVVTKSCPRN